MGKVLGIDLGTGNSCASIYENGQTTIIPNAEGDMTTPSVVSFEKDGTRTVGKIAKRQMIMNPLTVIHSVKRLIGKKYSQVQDVAKVLAYKITEGKNGFACVEINGKKYSPEEISSMVLAKLKADAEAFTGEAITDAVITVPAYFGDAERQATRDAGKIAGLNVLRIINEPTAACLAYGLDKKNSKIIAVGDIGCGTSDISILEYGDGVFEVLATNGDALLGGDDIDEELMKYVANDFKAQNGVDLLADNTAKARLKEACEKAKRELSSAMTTSISLPFITATSTGPLHLSMDITRAKFEQLVSKVFDKFEEKVRQCIADSKKDVSEISDIIMVGGSTRIPYIQQFFSRIFGKEVNKTVNPDEVVAAGAAIEAAVLTGDSSVNDVVLLDVTSLSYGIETVGDLMTVLIPRGTTIPTKKTETFSTAADSQPCVTVRVYEGERAKASDNKLIGQFDLDGIPPAPRGVPKIEVTYDIDANGVLNVTAKDVATNRQQHITITQNGGLTEEEIARMIRDAEANREADKKAKEDQELINRADSLAFTVEKQVNDNSGKLPQDLKDRIASLVEEVRRQKGAKDIEGLKASVESLQSEAMKIGEAIYGASGQPGMGQQAAEGPAESPKANDGTVDAEVIG